jgi:hypothetical protein
MYSKITVDENNVNSLIGKTIRAFDRDGWHEGVVVQIQGVHGIYMKKLDGGFWGVAHYNVKEVKDN